MAITSSIARFAFALALSSAGPCAFAQTLPIGDAFTAWAEQSGTPIRSVTSEDYSDLQFLKAAVGDARVVMLGESSHGVKEYHQARSRITRFLHDEMGFEVVALEGPMFDCALGNGARAYADPTTLMWACFYPLAHTQETLDFIRSLKDRPSLELTGFDNQINGFATHKRHFFQTLTRPIDEGYARHVDDVEERFWAARTGDWRANLRLVKDGLAPEYVRLAALLQAQAVQTVDSEKRRDLLFGVQVALATENFISWMASDDDGAGYRARDENMASNLAFIANVSHPNQKIVVWAHNAHISRSNETIAYGGLAGPGEGQKSMGGHFSQSGIPAVSVGLFARRGEMALADRTKYAMSDLMEGSLEGLPLPPQAAGAFYDLRRGADGRPAPSEPVLVKHWGFAHYPVVLADQYDAVLVIDQVSAPEFWTAPPRDSSSSPLFVLGTLPAP